MREASIYFVEKTWLANLAFSADCGNLAGESQWHGMVNQDPVQASVDLETYR